MLDAALECAAKKHLEVPVVTSRRSPNWFEAHREALNKAIAFRNECSSQLFKRPKDAAVKAEFAEPLRNECLGPSGLGIEAWKRA